jgi:hypothetical protein
MQRKSQPVDIVNIDIERLEKDSAFPGAYAFYIKLSGEPDDIWRGFLAKWDSALKVMQREIAVGKDSLRVVFAYGDNVQNCVNYVTQLISWVNNQVADYNKKATLMEKEGLRKQEKERRREEQILQQLKQANSKPFTAMTEVAIKDLASAYENDSVAYERYRNNILRIKGLVNVINLKHNYVVLTDALGSLTCISCAFDTDNSYKLKNLKSGQTVTVTGEYEGSALQLSMRHCNITG